MVKLAFGNFGDSFSIQSLKSYLSEFIATLLFVFAGVGSAIAYSKCVNNHEIIVMKMIYIEWSTRKFYLSVKTKVAKSILFIRERYLEGQYLIN